MRGELRELHCRRCGGPICQRALKARFSPLRRWEGVEVAAGAGRSPPLRFLSSLAPMGSRPHGDSHGTPGCCPPVPASSRAAPVPAVPRGAGGGQAPSRDPLPPPREAARSSGPAAVRGRRGHSAPGRSEAGPLGKAGPFSRCPLWWCPSVLCPVPSQCDLRRLGEGSRAERGSPCPAPAPRRAHGDTPSACSAASGEGSEGAGRRRGHLRTLLPLISQIQPTRGSA